MRRAHEMPFGAALKGRRCRFRLWAPAARQISLRLHGRLLPMEEAGEGWWGVETGAAAGDAYAYVLEDGLEIPDPAARAQAADVHGPSLVVDPRAYAWQDREWAGRPWHEAVLYELHVGTFTAAGSFDGVRARLSELRDLGVTALELMPVADFPGRRDWGYDGVLPFAPDRNYGTPEQLKALVDAAHRCGLMVLLDVVYNHFGPEGNYLHRYAPDFFNDRHATPWGAAIDFTRPTVRRFFIHNALYWLEEFHFDGLRLDAVHAIYDDTRPDILQELAAAVRSRFPGRRIHLVLENDENQARYLRPGPEAFDAQWNDDFHHALHVIVTAEEGGYYEDFARSPHLLLARALSEGFAYQGEYSLYRGRQRGEAARGVPLTAFVNFLQNHDQIGNRACGERLGALAGEQAVRAATAVLLLAPSPPLLFMGQEWNAGQPFPFFCDFGPDLGPRVSEGRRREFARFLDFSQAAAQARIPDPQAPETWDAAVLRWSAREHPASGAWLAFHRELLRVRHREIVPRVARAAPDRAVAVVIGESVVAARWRLGEEVLVLLANLGPEPVADVGASGGTLLYATDGALGENDTLSPWGVAWYLAGEGTGRVCFNGEEVLA